MKTIMISQTTIVSLLQLLFAILGLCSATYYVTPHSNTLCPAQPCLTLSRYMQEANLYFTSNVTFVFLAGEHSLSADLVIKDVTNVTLMGDSSSLPQINSRIKCTTHAKIIFDAVMEIKVTALAFASCGNSTSNVGAIHLANARDVLFSDCILHNNAFTSLSANLSSFTLNKITFVNNFQSALKVFNSKVYSISNSSFINNNGFQGGAAAIFNSTVKFTDVTVSASYSGYGGSLYLQNSVATFTGINLFSDNYAWYGGGVLHATYSHLHFEGDSSFINNSASLVGGVFYASRDTTVHFDGNSSFVQNLAGKGGGALQASNRTTISFNGNCSFINNSASNANSGGGVIDAWDNSVINFNGSCSFIDNLASSGGGISVADSTLSISGTCSFINNVASKGGGIASWGSTMTFDGNCSFINNSAHDNGGVIMGVLTTMMFSGSCMFIDNSAQFGGGLALYSSVYYLQQHNSKMYFRANRAQRGGAVFAIDSVHYVSLKCFFQIQVDTANYPSDSNALNVSVSLDFENNSAFEAGEDVYGGEIDSCYWPYMHPQVVYRKTTGELIDLLAPNLMTGKLSAISSDPMKVCVCDSSGHPDCDRRINVTSYPGETFTVTAVAVGQRNGTVPAVIEGTFERDSTANVRNDETFQNSSKTCTNLHYTVFSNAGFERLNLYVEGLDQALTNFIKLQPCPEGFQLSPTTKACTCEERLQVYTNSCDINDQTITRDGEFWIGYDGETGGVILHPHCPFDYCKSVPVSFAFSDSDLQCNNDRSGLICGGCQPGLSLALGTSRCFECSHIYFLLLIPFALAGLLLVIFLLACRLTVAVGTISGLIFYANIVAVNQSIFIPQDSSLYSRFLSLFIAWLNLDLGIETCFYNGLDAYAKTWLQFVFPIYIWALVGLVVISSRYSSTVSRTLGTNPVAVLATLFLLSYAKLLRTIIAALSFANLQYPNGTKTVWLYDGNTTYLSGKHVPLFVAAMAVFYILFLPYTLLLLLGQCLQAKSNWKFLAWVNSPRLKAFMDAYHGPYRDECRYWPGLLLLIRIVLLLIFGSNANGNPSVNLLAISACVIGLLTLTRVIHGVYKEWYLEALEAFFILNLGILAASTHHVRLSGGSQAAVAYTSLGTAFVVFIGIVVYHVYIQIRDCQKVRNYQRVKTTDETEMAETAPEIQLHSQIKEQIITEETRILVGFTEVPEIEREPLLFMDNTTS